MVVFCVFLGFALLDVFCFSRVLLVVWLFFSKPTFALLSS